MAKGEGMLEANPAALAVVVLFFLVFTLGFEHLLHWLRRYLMRKKKMGLLAAVNNFCSEIMLLGVAILLLMVCEDKIAATCYRVPKDHDTGAMKPWLARVVGTDQQKGCACCLTKTAGISKCFMQSKGCPYDADKKCANIAASFPFLKGIKHESEVLPAEYPKLYDNSTAYPAKAYPTADSRSVEGAEKQNSSVPHFATTGKAPKRRLTAAAEDTCEKSVECVGAHQKKYPECNNAEGWAPIVTIATLHQVHMLLFFLAITHIITGSIMLLISSTKLKYYARRAGNESSDKLATASIAAAQADHNRTASFSPKSSFNAVHVAMSPVSDTATQLDGESAFAMSQKGGNGEGVPVATADPWNGRPYHLGCMDFLVEALVYFVRQVTLWRTVSKQEYAVLRASFYYTHAHVLTQTAHHGDHDDHGHGGHGHGHDDHAFEHSHSLASSHVSSSAAPLRPDQVAAAYTPYITEQVERDGADVVGLGLPMWICLLLFVLVSGVIGWATWLFLILAGALLFFLNMVLLTTLRHMTRGGHVVRQEEKWYHWLHRHNFLLGCIKLALFFFTFAISNAIFMAANFGPESCFFSRTGFQRAPVPWWAIMVVDIMLLINLGLFTLPLYSLTYHTLVVDRSLLQSTVRDILYHKACADMKKSGDFIRRNGGSNGGANPGEHKGKVQRLKTFFSKSFVGTWSDDYRQDSRNANRISSSGSSRRWEGANVQMATPVSDNRRWAEDQAAQSV